VPQGAAEAVEFPDDEGVAGAEMVQELLEDGAVGAGAAGGLGEYSEQPAAVRASTWSWGCWSVVETRA